MVKPNNTFLIDAHFIIQRAHHEFLGATLLSNQGKDHTFTFAFARDFLRLRQLFGVRKGVVVIGRDAHALATDQNIEDVVHFLSDFNIPCVHNALDDTHNIIGSMCAGFTHLVTAELTLLQLVTDRVMVGLAQHAARTQYKWITLENIRKEMGVNPEDVPTYLTLTRGVGTAALTSRQAARLIELYGDLNSILDNLATISPRQMRRKLETSASDAKSYYARCRIARTPEAWRHDMGTLQVKLGTKRHLALLSTYGFWSLKPLLRTPAIVYVEPSAIRAEVQSYRAVVDRAGLKRLEAEVKNAKMCAIDSESDGTDPRRATLFGVSFAVKAGEAHFVPLLDDDLKGVSRIEVIKALRRICASSVHFIGHNVKYDYVLLRRHGIRLRAIHFDTMLAAYECYGDWTFFNLPYLCQKLLGKSVKS